MGSTIYKKHTHCSRFAMLLALVTKDFTYGFSDSSYQYHGCWSYHVNHVSYVVHVSLNGSSKRLSFPKCLANAITSLKPARICSNVSVATPYFPNRYIDEQIRHILQYRLIHLEPWEIFTLYSLAVSTV